jgi:hypothetical protein
MLTAASHLTDRDRKILSALAGQRVLTTGMIAELGFGSSITARHRMIKLTDLGLVARFRPPRAAGSSPWHYLLTDLGAHVVAANTEPDQEQDRGDQERTLTRIVTRARNDRAAALAGRAYLAHLLGANGVYTSLAAAARTSDGKERLEWHGERDGWKTLYSEEPVRPDGYGTWREEPGCPSGLLAPASLAFLLEYDTGTERHQTLVDKLRAYNRLGFGDPVPAVLFVFTTTGRENAVRASLAPVCDPEDRLVATAVHASGVDASGPIWAPLNGPYGTVTRVRLSGLAAHLAEHERRRAQAAAVREAAENARRGRYAADRVSTSRFADEDWR